MSKCYVSVSKPWFCTNFTKAIYAHYSIGKEALLHYHTVIHSLLQKYPQTTFVDEMQSQKSKKHSLYVACKTHTVHVHAYSCKCMLQLPWMMSI